MKKINTAIMGYGHIGKVHEQAIAELSNVDFVAIIDNKINQNDCPEIPIFKSINDLKNSDIEVDLIIIATPNGLHFQHAKEALEACFHVLVEKPITLNARDLETLIFTSQTTGKRLFNMLQLRYSPQVAQVKDWLDNDILGQVFLINVQCYWNRNNAYYEQREWHGTKKMDGGVLFTQFSHFVDVLHYWFNELKPKDVRSFNFAHKDSTEFADSGIINFKTNSDAFGTMTYTTATYDRNFESTITILAEKGTLQIGGQYMNEFNYVRIEGEDCNMENSGKFFHAKAIKDVVESIQQGKSSILDAENARNVIKFLEVVS